MTLNLIVSDSVCRRKGSGWLKFSVVQEGEVGNVQIENTVETTSALVKGIWSEIDADLQELDYAPFHVQFFR